MRASGLSALRPHAGHPARRRPSPYPLRDQGLIRTRQAAQVRGLAGEWLVQFAVGCTFEDPGDLGEQIELYRLWSRTEAWARSRRLRTVLSWPSLIGGLWLIQQLISFGVVQTPRTD